MIRYGLKLWTKNQNLFEEAAQRFKEGTFDFIEFYYHPEFPLDAETLRPLVGIPMGVHAPHELDDFLFGEKELKLWERTKSFVDLVNASSIVVHPGYADTVPDMDAFHRELAKIDDPRVLIETMPGKDTLGRVLFGYDLPTLKSIHETKAMCLDFEKSMKSAIYQKLDWKSFLDESMKVLTPNYFHISGGSTSNDLDEHTDLWESDMDWAFVKRQLESVPGEARLVFETPKNGKDLANDLDNFVFFRKVAT